VEVVAVVVVGVGYSSWNVHSLNSILEAFDDFVGFFVVVVVVKEMLTFDFVKRVFIPVMITS
jgi:hypothetical protein